MMFVAVRYYQQSMEAYDWDEDENDETIDIGEQSRKIESTSGEINKIKKKL